MADKEMTCLEEIDMLEALVSEHLPRDHYRLWRKAAIMEGFAGLREALRGKKLNHTGRICQLYKLEPDVRYKAIEIADEIWLDIDTIRAKEETRQRLGLITDRRRFPRVSKTEQAVEQHTAAILSHMVRSVGNMNSAKEAFDAAHVTWSNIERLIEALGAGEPVPRELVMEEVRTMKSQLFTLGRQISNVVSCGTDPVYAIHAATMLEQAVKADEEDGIDHT